MEMESRTRNVSKLLDCGRGLIKKKNFFDTNFSLNTKHPVIYILNSNRYWFTIRYYEFAVPRIARDATRLLHLLSLHRNTDLSQTVFSTPGYAIFFNFQNSTVEKVVEKLFKLFVYAPRSNSIEIVIVFLHRVITRALNQQSLFIPVRIVVCDQVGCKRISCICEQGAPTWPL